MWAEESQIERAADLVAACEAVCADLAARVPLMPSTYIERDGLLRCIAQRGYWQILDGIPVDTGVMARSFREGEVVLVDDVASDPGFLEAVPGLRAQCSVPLRAGGAVVGVLTVESPAQLSAEDVDATVVAGSHLSEWMDRHWEPPEETPLERLGRSARALTGLSDERAVEMALVRLACEVSGMSSAVLVRPGQLDMLERRATHGPLALAFSALSTADLHRLRESVAAVSSSYTSADAAGRTLPATEKLRGAGVEALAAVPLRSIRGDDVGLLAVADAEPLRIDTDDIEALELLVAEAARALDLSHTVAELRDRAARDPLTGLGNHRAFHEAIRARAQGDDRFAVLMADLDRFKEVNDTRGHLEGDRVLSEVAAAMARALRGADRIFRVGGDEFAALLTSTDPVAAAGLGERLEQAAEPVLRPYGASLSVGVGIPVAGEHVNELLTRADSDLYRVKRARCKQEP